MNPPGTDERCDKKIYYQTARSMRSHIILLNSRIFTPTLQGDKSVAKLIKTLIKYKGCDKKL
jgi:hypothetical protein